RGGRDGGAAGELRGGQRGAGPARGPGGRAGDRHRGQPGPGRVDGPVPAPGRVRGGAQRAELNRPGFSGGRNFRGIGVMNEAKRYSREIRERAVRLVLDPEGEYPSQWAAIESMAEKIGCSSDTLRRWVRQAERDEGKRPGARTAELERIKGLERENRE